MKLQTPRSFKALLIVRLLGFQVGLFLLTGAVLAGYVVYNDDGRSLIEPDFADVAANAIIRDRHGKLHLVDTPELVDARRRVPDLWFVARDARGEVISYNKTPTAYAGIANSLEHITFAYIKDEMPPYRYIASVRLIDGPAGELTILGTSQTGDWTVRLFAAGADILVFGRGAVLNTVTMLLLLSSTIMVPFLMVLSLITIVAIPLIVGKTFRRLSVVAGEASRVDIDRRGSRLSSDGIPAEIVPLINAMNGALRRLDEGYEQHQRFLSDAAHELRTPIAILRAKIEAAPDSTLAWRLQSDVARLATLAEQMLDLQRIGRASPLDDPVDLGDVVREVVADLAPLAIAGGKELAVADVGSVFVRGDTAAIGRVLANLIQNALEHGGHQVIVRVEGTTIEVEDDGPGIPLEERERVFDAFHRLRRGNSGAGLGLNLVREVMIRHGGSVEPIEASSGGTIMRLEFVAATQS